MNNGLDGKIAAYFGGNAIGVFGINAASLMDGAPEGYRPRDFLPDVKSMVCFALPVPLGVYSLAAYRSEFVWRTQSLLYRQLDTHALNIAGLLENEGYRALPLSGCMPQRYNARKEPVGYVNMIRMGSLTGIGFVGRNGLLINSLYGARMMLGAVLTNAELAPACEPGRQAQDCPEGCDICSSICPVGAIHPGERRVKIFKCLAYTATTPFLPRFRFFLLRALRPDASMRLLNMATIDEHILHDCSLCVSECPYGRKTEKNEPATVDADERM